MKRINSSLAPVLLAVLLSVVFNPLQPASVFASRGADKTEYVCPPCSCDKDNEVFDKPGTCTSCGMKLVEKGSGAARPMPAAERRKVAILVFDGVQIIDYTGPWEVFGQAGFDVYTVALKADPIRTNMGMKVIPNYTVENNPKPDILVVPGGGVLNTQKDPKALKWVQETADKAEVVLSVCNGAYILAKAGLLNGLTATTTAPLIDGLSAAAPNIKVVYDKRFVDNGKIITTGGLSSGIDGSLHVVSRLLGRGRAQAIALGIEYNWHPEGGFVRPALADKYLNYSFDGLRCIVLNREGDTEYWENRYLVTGRPSAAETLELINKTFATEGKWIKQDFGKPNDLTSHWKFADERGLQWNALASLQPLVGEKNKFLFSAKVARADRKQIATANPTDPNKIIIRDAWIQEGPPSQKLVAAFMVIENQGAVETELVSARTDVASVVELHKMDTTDEVMRMDKVDLISVPGEGKAELRPSGFHLMLIGLNKEIRQGDEVAVTLQFANSVQKTIRIPVRKREAMGN